MIDPKKNLTVESCKHLIKVENKILIDYQKKHEKMEKRLKTSQKAGAAINQELNEINFLNKELQKNLAGLQDGSIKNLHLEKISALKLRQISLEKRKPFYTVEEYDGIEQELLAFTTMESLQIIKIAELEARIIELNEEEEGKKLI